MNTSTQLSLPRLRRAKQTRYNPLTYISDPVQVGLKLDAFESGYLKEAVNIWDTLEQRDDLIRAVVSKRKKAVGRQGWTVLIRDSIGPDQRKEAQLHAAALEYFYENLRCENAFDRTEKGGFKLLCRQMMDAVGKRFAVHEIVWNVKHHVLASTQPSRTGGPQAASAVVDPSAVEASLPSFPSVKNGSVQASSSRSSRPSREQNFLTATFRFVPLSFFENTTGTLRFLESESATEGIPLDPGAWMVTVGDGLMMATSSAWILKNMTLNDWLVYSERNGRPALRASTPATPDSPEWAALSTSLDEILNGNAVVHNSSDDIKVLDLAAGGNIPFPELVDRMDRMIAALWRGADLSTISRDRGYGASLQEKETCALEEDDAEMLTETLNEYVDQWVIRYIFGEDAAPLANVKVLVSPKECTTADIQIDEFLYRTGAPLSLQETMSRYGRALPKPGEPILQFQQPHRSRRRRQESQISAQSEIRVGQSRTYPGFPTESSYPESSHRATTHVHNSEDAHDCELDSAVTSRDNSPALVAVPHKSAALMTAQPTISWESDNSPGSEPSVATATSNSISNSVISVPSVAKNKSSLFPSVKSSPTLAFSPQPLAFPNDFDLRASKFELLQGDWLQLSPYGDFPHSRGVQRVNRTAVDTMVAHFNSFRGRVGRLFGGVPFYVGHPDLPNTSELADRKAYGWIMQLEARADGLCGQVKWSEAGLDLLKNAHYKYLSPFWEAKEVMSENGRKVYQPVALVSVGLTNQPNIPVKPLANQQNDVPPNHNLNPNLPCPSSSRAACHVPRGDEAQTTATTPTPEDPEPCPSLQNTEATPLSNTQLELGEPNQENPPAVSTASPLSPLSPVENPHSATRNPQLMPNDSQPLALSPEPLAFSLHTTSITENLNRRRAEVTRMQNHRQRIRDSVQSKIRLGLSYDDAWQATKEEHHEWFTNQNQNT